MKSIKRTQAIANVAYLLIPYLWIVSGCSNKVQEIELSAFDTAAFIQAIEMPGDWVDGKHWTDADGEHIVWVSQDVEELYAGHLIKQGDNYSPVWLAMDSVPDCYDFIVCEHIPSSLLVTDIDNDQVPEVSFMYRKACRPTFVPAELKFVLFEQKSMYLIEGLTSLEEIPNIQSEYTKAPKIINTIPDEFSGLANKQWELFKKE